MPLLGLGARFGAFHITRVIARGGMGVVYAGTDENSGRQVAIKTVFAISSHLLPSIRREIEALSRLRHPGIVGILAHGAEQGIPWYAMELLEGHTLDELLRSQPPCDVEPTLPATGAPLPGPTVAMSGQTPPLPGDQSAHVPVASARYDDARSSMRASAASTRAGDTPPTVARNLHIVRRLCEPLAFLHGEGLIHRDLKPANVFLRNETSPVLVDFGLAQSFGGATTRERLTDAEGPPGGTVAYIAPEQIARGLVDPRSDLYSLGCILYQVVAGRPPFVGSSQSVLRAHLIASPPPLGLMVPWVMPALEELIMRLLAKNPRDRMGYAEDVARALSDMLPPPMDEAPLARPRVRTYLYRPTFNGRDQVLDALVDLLPHGTSERPAVVLIEGGPGVGKTRLAAELAALARQRVRVIKGECLPRWNAGPADAPLHVFRPVLQAVADHCREHGATEVARLVGPRAAVLAAYEPALAELAKDAQPQRLDSAGDERARLHTWFAEILAAFAEAKPILLLLDDVHWADEVSLGLLEAMADGKAAIGKTVVICTCHAESEQLAALRIRSRVKRFTIDPLDHEAISRLIGDMLSLPTPPDDLVARLSRVSGGNPFYLGEYLHTAVAVGHFTRSLRGEWVLGTDGSGSVSLPASLGELLALRLGTLERDDYQVLELGAVIGPEFTSALLAAVTPHDDSGLLLSISRLLARHVLVEAAPGRFRFAHDNLQRTVYQRLFDDRRRALHHRVAETLQALGAAEAHTLAHHYSEAGDAVQAHAYLIRAGLEAQRMAASATACTLFERAFELEREPGVSAEVPGLHRSEVFASYASAVHGTGKIGQAGGLIRQTLATLDIAIPSRRGGWIRRTLRELCIQVVSLLRGRRSASEDTQDAVRLALLNQLRLLYQIQSARLPYLCTALMAINLADRMDAALAPPYAGMASVAEFLGLRSLSRHYLDRAHQAARAADGHGLSDVYHAEVFIALCRGWWQQMATAAARCIELCHEAGDFHNLSRVHALQAGAASVRGCVHVGLRNVSQGRELTRKYGYVFEETMLLLNGADLELLRQRPEAAEAMFEEAERMAEVADDPLRRLILDLWRARSCVMRGKWAEARVNADATLARLRQREHGPGSALALLRLPALFLALYESSGSRERILLASAREATRRLEGIARLQPAARPMAMLYRAQLARHEGRYAAADKILERAVAHARRCDVPYAEACILDERARLVRTDVRLASADATSWQQQANTLFEQIGAAGHFHSAEEID